MSLLTLKQASEQLNVSKATICNWAKAGKIDFILLPNNVRRFKIESITGGGEGKKNLKTVLFMPESQPESKLTTLNDKSKSSETSTQTTKSSKTSGVESTTNEKVFNPWWNSYCWEVSQKLWLPTKTDCVGLDLTSLNSSLKNMVPTSWFSITKNVPENKNWYKMSFLSLQSSQLGLTVLESIKPKSKKILKTKKRKKKFRRKKKNVDGLHRSSYLRMFPNKKQREELRRWFGTARYCYNLVISMYKKDNSIPLNYDTRKKVLETIPFDHKGVNLEVKRNAIKEAFDTI
jgi:hypothetical protein